MKLRMLNGTHSALAYLGYLAGHETIADCMADPVFAAFVRTLWRDEIIPALTPPPGVDLPPMPTGAGGPLSQPRHPPPHLADRDGRQPEAAAAHPWHAGREPGRRPPQPGPDPRRRGLDGYVGGTD
jgi:hypothetical protein